MSEKKVSGRKPRRNWPKGLKKQIVEESNEPGVSVCAVARRYDLDPGQLFQWRKKFGVSVSGSEGATSAADFVAVEVSGGSISSTSGVDTSMNEARIEIAFPNGRHLFAPADTPRDALDAMIAAVSV